MYHLKWDNSMKQIKILFKLEESTPILCAIKPEVNNIWIICAKLNASQHLSHLYIKEYSTQTPHWISKATFMNFGYEFNCLLWHKKQIQFVSVYDGNFLLAFNYLPVNKTNQGIYIFDIYEKQKYRSSIKLPCKLNAKDQTLYVSSIIDLNRDEKIVQQYIRQFTHKQTYMPFQLCKFMSRWYQNEFIQMTIATSSNETIKSLTINVDIIIQNLQ